MSYTKELVDYILNLTYDELPGEVLDASKKAILDCLGVSLVSLGEKSVKILSQYIKDAGKPEAGVIGECFKTTVDSAAWVNGTKAHAIDYDDYFIPEGQTPYHPTVAILPAVLAVGEKWHLSGKDVLLAYVTGFETQVRIALACSKHSFAFGWHTTSTLGSFGATAAVAKMLNLDKETTKTALGICGSLSAGLRKNFGTMTKPLHAGNAARNGVVSAMLAQNGFTADRDIMDSQLGFYALMGGESQSSELRSIPGVSPKSEFFILCPGIAFKLYPSCAYTHWAIDAALELKSAESIGSNNIVSVECRTNSKVPDILIHSRPKTALEGKFSLEYCVAVALLDGEVSLKQFTDERVNEPSVQELISKTKYVHPPEMELRPFELAGEVVVKLQDGRAITRRVDVAKGDPRNPPTFEELSAKYENCTHSLLSVEDMRRSSDMILHLESISDVGELMHILTYIGKTS